MENRRKFFISVVIFAFAFSYCLYKGHTLIYGDTSDYIEYANLFNGFDKINFYNIILTNKTIAMRGYFFPFILKIFLVIFRGYGFAIIMLNSSVFILGVYLFNRSVLNNKKDTSILFTSICYFITVFIYLGIFDQALTDVFAFSCLLILVSIFNILMINVDSNIKQYLLLVVAGILFYGIYNTRTIYKLALIILALYYLWFLIYRNKYIIKLLIIFISFIFAALPQCIINDNYFHNFTPKIITTEVYQNNVAIQQLSWGLQYQRYDTYYSTNENSRNAQVFFDEDLFDDYYERINKITNFKDYLIIVAEKPISYLILMGKHLINILSPIFQNVYISSLKINYLGLILNFFVLFFGSIALYQSIKNNRLSKKSITVLAICLIPTLMILPGAVESRYGFGMYLIFLTILVSDYADVIAYSKQKMVPLFTVFLITLIIYIFYINNLIQLII